MKLKLLRFLLILFSALGLALCVLIGLPDAASHDVVTENRILYEAKKYIENPESADFSDAKYPFAILDENQKPVFSSDENAVTEMSLAMKKSETILPVILDNSDFKGYLIITVSLESAQIRQSHVLMQRIAILLVFLFSAIVMIIYERYLHKDIIQPFESIKRFTREIAGGNLDAPLPVQNVNKAFMPFIQSFDIMREELKMAKKREYEANQSKKELVASLSHDIKTPVTSIKLALEVMLVKASDEETKQRLEAIYRKNEQIDRLVSDLFNTTMEDLEELNVTTAEIYSSELMPLLSDADLYENISVAPLPDCMIIADTIRLGQVFSNIIYNSRKYANTELKISGAIHDTFLDITFSDKGGGVEPDELPLLFNRFYRGKNAAEKTGSGLGLYICKSLLEKMGGEIYCMNTEDGFAVTVRLPVAE